MIIRSINLLSDIEKYDILLIEFKNGIIKTMVVQEVKDDTPDGDKTWVEIILDKNTNLFFNLNQYLMGTSGVVNHVLKIEKSK